MKTNSFTMLVACAVAMLICTAFGRAQTVTGTITGRLPIRVAP